MGKIFIFTIKSITCLFIFFISSSQTQGNVEIWYEDKEIQKVVNYISSHFGEEIQSPDNLMVLTIAAPEIMRYNYFSDFLETGALELLYIEGGTAMVDFSIGPFQMKPSFIEELERNIVANDKLESFCQITIYELPEVQKKRRRRLWRMQSSKYQFDYLSAFKAYCELKYADYLFKASTEQQLKFMATAYNMGFENTTEEVLQYSKKENFPYGSSYKGEQYAYGDYAVMIYQNLNKQVCN